MSNEIKWGIHEEKREALMQDLYSKMYYARTKDGRLSLDELTAIGDHQRYGWITTKQLAKVLKLSRQTIWRYTQSGKLPKPKVNPVSERKLFSVTEIVDYLKDNNG